MIRCPFCAEDIQDAAVLCRYCGASRAEGADWAPPAGPLAAAKPVRGKARPGAFTIKTAGVFFVLSGTWSLLSVTSDAPLFGSMVSGAAALCYNILFVALFCGMGIGLITGRRWGYRLMMAGTALYSLDRLLVLLSKETRDGVYISEAIREAEAVLGSSIISDELIVLSGAVSVLCWWGFALYLYLRRAYFI